MYLLRDLIVFPQLSNNTSTILANYLPLICISMLYLLYLYSLEPGSIYPSLCKSLGDTMEGESLEDFGHVLLDIDDFEGTKNK